MMQSKNFRTLHKSRVMQAAELCCAELITQYRKVRFVRDINNF